MPLERMYLETSWKWYLIIDKHNCWDYTNNLIWINKLFIQPIQNICTCTLVECQERSPWNYLWIIPYLGEIQMKSPHMYCGMSMIFLPFLAPPATPFLATTCWIQGLELVNLSSWRRTVYQIPILRPCFFYDCVPGKFYENPDLRLEVNSSEILRTKR